MAQMHHPHEYVQQLSDAELQAQKHQGFVGGMWDEIGKLQFEFLIAQGLRDEHVLLDVGCGALRGGIHFIRHLKPGNYCGIDMNESLIRAGRDIELPRAGLAHCLPNLLVDEEFSFGKFGVKFDFALAFSVFTHVPLNTIEICLARISEVLKPGGRFFATFFSAPSRPAIEPIVHEPGGVTTYSDRNPFHYYPGVFAYLTENMPLKAREIGDFGHPRSQKMLEFTRV